MSCQENMGHHNVKTANKSCKVRKSTNISNDTNKSKFHE